MGGGGNKIKTDLMGKEVDNPQALRYDHFAAYFFISAI
jgi:hypothetical protein